MMRFGYCEMESNLDKPKRCKIRETDEGTTYGAGKYRGDIHRMTFQALSIEVLPGVLSCH